MKVLVFGGTRFAGKEVVENLLGKGVKVTVCSRSVKYAPNEAEVIEGEKEELLLRKERWGEFDIIIDFTVYNKKSVALVLETFPKAYYILISSVWVTKLGAFPVDVVPQQVYMNYNLPLKTREYVKNKLEAEQLLVNSKSKGAILRLPIMLGRYDHTKRLEFYAKRILDERGVALVNGGEHLFQPAYVSDVAFAISELTTGLLNYPLPSVMDALPRYPILLKDFVISMAKVLEREPKIISISEEELRVQLPCYLEEEPFWRERFIEKSSANVFDILSASTTPVSSWLSKSLQGTKSPHGEERLRLKEIDYFMSRRN